MNNTRLVHPGEILKQEFLIPLKMSAGTLANHLQVHQNRIREVVKGERALTANTVLRLARFFGTTPEFWMNLQKIYELHLAQSMWGDKIEQEVSDQEYVKEYVKAKIKAGIESADKEPRLSSSDVQEHFGVAEHQ